MGEVVGDVVVGDVVVGIGCECVVGIGEVGNVVVDGC